MIRKFFSADYTIGGRIELDANDGINSMKRFKDALKEAKGDLLEMTNQFGETSDEARTAAKRVAELNDLIGDTNELTKAFNPDAKFKSLSQSLNGVLGGFTALTGAMGVLGVESENVQKQLLKVQSAMALSQGLNQIGESINSFKTLGRTIIENLGSKGLIGLAIAGVAALTAAIFGVFDKTSQKVKTLNDSLKELGKAEFEARKEVNLLKAAFKQAEAGVISKDEALKKYNDGLGQTIGKAKDLNEAERLTNENAKAYIEVQGLKAQANFLIAKSAEAAATAMVIQAKIEEEGAKGRIGSATQQLVNQMTSAVASFDAEISKIEARIVTASAKFKTAVPSSKDEQKTGGAGGAAGKPPPEVYKSIVKQYQEIDQAQTDFEISQAKLKLEREKALQTELANLDQQGLANHTAIVDRQTRLEMIATQTRIRLAEEEQEHKRQIAAATASLLDNVAELVGKNTLAGKIMAVASATINTYLAVTKALSSAAPPINFIMAASSLAAGLAAIKNIVKVQIPGQSGGGNIPGGSVSPPLSPQLPGVTNTRLDQNQLNQIGNAAVRAFVVESDVSTNQERIRRTNRAARIG